MSKEKHNLYVFGYGVSLIIPFLILMHTLKHALGFGAFLWVLLIGFVLVMILAVKAANMRPIVNAWIFLVLAWSFMDTFSCGYRGLPFIFLGAAFLFLTATILNVNLLMPVYDKWMVVAHFIGSTITAIVLTVFFYLAFGVAGIVLKVMNKDLLDQKLEPDRNSYWTKRDPAEFDRKHFERQF